MYTKFESGVESVVQCAGLCQAQALYCNTFFHDKLLSSCALADLNGNYSREQRTSAFGYIMQGNQATVNIFCLNYFYLE